MLASKFDKVCILFFSLTEKISSISTRPCYILMHFLIEYFSVLFLQYKVGTELGLQHTYGFVCFTFKDHLGIAELFY